MGNVKTTFWKWLEAYFECKVEKGAILTSKDILDIATNYRQSINYGVRGLGKLVGSKITYLERIPGSRPTKYVNLLGNRYGEPFPKFVIGENGSYEFEWKEKKEVSDGGSVSSSDK